MRLFIFLFDNSSMSKPENNGLQKIIKIFIKMKFALRFYVASV